VALRLRKFQTLLSGLLILIKLGKSMNYHLRNKKNMVAGNGNFEQIGPSRKKLDTNIFPTVFEYDWLEKIFKK